MICQPDITSTNVHTLSKPDSYLFHNCNPVRSITNIECTTTYTDCQLQVPDEGKYSFLRNPCQQRSILNILLIMSDDNTSVKSLQATYGCSCAFLWCGMVELVHCIKCHHCGLANVVHFNQYRSYCHKSGTIAFITLCAIEWVHFSVASLVLAKVVLFNHAFILEMTWTDCKAVQLKTR